MNSLFNGVKCVQCIREGLKDKVVAESVEPVQWAVDGARTAVTLIKGDALCVEHIHQNVVNSALSGLNPR